PVEPCWGHLRPFAILSLGMCEPGAHPAYSEDPASEFYQAALEVYETVNDLTDEQRTIAFYWADLAGETATPAGHSLSITTQVLEQVAAPLDLAAEAIARVGIGESDAFIGCWATKYHYSLLRPISYINSVIDPDWESVLETPPFPAYTSGHSNDVGSASTILTTLFGDGFAFTDHFNDALGFAPRSFGSFFEAADESAISRLYGGIHYRFDIERGVEQGRCVGRAVNALEFRGATLAAR
ncbi:MAG TPA: vanadium-dependent haloperoxidase, partial [Gemmatimonadota bacterium]|nr:vanadium-dependent haloperoxidase [Gemmatimonadota bacterium]